MGIVSSVYNVFSNCFTIITQLFSRNNQCIQLDYSNDFNRNYNRRLPDRGYASTYREFTGDTRFRFNAAPDRGYKFLQMEPLDAFTMPENILTIERNEYDLVNGNDLINGWISEKSNFRLSEDLYINAYKMMAFFEEAAETITIESYNLTDVCKDVWLNQIDGNDPTEFYFNVKARSDELITAIDDKKLNYFLLLSTKSRQMICDGKINRRLNEQIFVKIFWNDFRSDEHYDLIFKVNRMNVQLQQNALKFIQEHRLFPILINNPLYLSQSHSSKQSDVPHFQSAIYDLNAEQMAAIEYIVSGTYNPVPYLLYGPPGTGKTKTVVAAIENIVRTTIKKILVCSQSNAACNEIAERLAKVLTPTEMLRMFSKSYDLNEISDTIKPFCNLFDNKLQYPALDELYKFRVLICTLSTSGCLVRARNSTDFNAHHFGFVFIDECASAHETMALIPIAGVCTSVGKVHANIVLIGDPKQLDAVTKSPWSTQLGFKTSWFEQLFDSAMYKRNKMTGKFNATFITQLVRNYRSHHHILKVPNELFYQNALESVVTPDLVRLDVEGLLCNTFPIIFQSVHGYCKKGDNDPSSYNMEEVQGRSYGGAIGGAAPPEISEKEKLLQKSDKDQICQSEIGVVSPYKLQCKIIRRHCAMKEFKDITIGSAETFQGQERKVMIMSCVRGGRTLGEFVRNPQRFNVMVTRAKSLLIVVGNPHLLSLNENWSTLMRYCFQHRSLIQDKKYFRPRAF